MEPISLTSEQKDSVAGLMRALVAAKEQLANLTVEIHIAEQRRLQAVSECIAKTNAYIEELKRIAIGGGINLDGGERFTFNPQLMQITKE